MYSWHGLKCNGVHLIHISRECLPIIHKDSQRGKKTAFLLCSVRLAGSSLSKDSSREWLSSNRFRLVFLKIKKVNSLWLCSVSCTKLFGILTGLRHLFMRVTWLGNSLPIRQLTASSPSILLFPRIQLKVVASVPQQKLPSWKELQPSILSWKTGHVKKDFKSKPMHPIKKLNRIYIFLSDVGSSVLDILFSEISAAHTHTRGRVLACCLNKKNSVNWMALGIPKLR